MKRDNGFILPVMLLSGRRFLVDRAVSDVEYISAAQAALISLKSRPDEPYLCSGGRVGSYFMRKP
tara:strand:- start:327 stop:521 length:195 start_codon:yes stop_codon:yes gene_type:complete